jgi:hypothetical protein
MYLSLPPVNRFDPWKMTRIPIKIGSRGYMTISYDD